MQNWKKSIQFILNRPFLIFLILIGALLQLAIIFPNGDISCKNNICGMWFNLRYMHDSLWHIALANNSFFQYPFINPNYDGAVLQGYNFLLDFIMYLLSLVKLSPFFSFYKLLPILFSVIFPLSIIRFGLILKKKPTYIYFLLFFCYFGSAFGYMLSLYYFGSLYESFLWRFPVSQTLQSGSILYNLQFAFSIIILLVLFPYLYKKNTTKDLIIIAIGIFLATGFKFFGGITLLLLFGLKELIDLIKDRRQFRKNIFSSLIYIASFILSIFIFYQPSTSTKSGSIFIFSPFAMVHSMIEEKEMFYSKDLTNARYYLYSIGGFSKKLIFVQIYSVVLLIFFNFGTRLISLGLLFRKKLFKDINSTDLPILFTIIISVIFTILFIQKGDWFNTMQFLFYGVFLANFFAAEYLSQLIQKKSLRNYLIVAVILLLTIPSNIDGLRYWNEKREYISSYELDALDTLKHAQKGVILTLSPQDSYIAAFTGKSLYFADPQVLGITGIDFQKRSKEIETLKPNDLKKVPIKYLYLYKSKKRDKTFINYLKKDKSYTYLFENKEIAVFQKKL